MQPLNRAAFPSDTGMTPATNHARPENSVRFRITRTLHATLIFCAAIVLFASSLNARFFEDEYAYISQSYYADLFFTGRLNHKLWLDAPAFDLQPVPKYLIGLAFRLSHLPMPGPADAWKWYESYHAFGGTATLIAARLTVIPLGALGCLALFACGSMLRDARTGTLAAIFLMINPLYSQQAHRAMADVPCEAFMLASLAAALGLWVRIFAKQPGISALILPGIAGLFAGMALLCKLNGFLCLAIVTAWCGIAWLVPGLAIGRKLAMSGATIVTIAVALGAAVALNPCLTAKPAGKLPKEARELRSKGVWQRFRHQLGIRLEISEGQKINFPDDALFDLPEKTRVVLMQGFGRFGPFGPRSADSTVRYDFTQDWGMFLWLPLVLLGLRESVRFGRAQLRAAKPPTGLALVVWAGCAGMVVTLYLPMAWDRYQLPIQSGNAVLAAVGITCLWDRLVPAVTSWLNIAGA
jgi:hypothetical protein